MSAIDVSSHQGLDIGPLLDRYQPEHVICKLYQPMELGGVGAEYPIAQAAAARAHGCTVGGYVWVYVGPDGRVQVANALATAARAQIELGPSNPLWLDCEDFTDGSYPSLGVIRQAVAECQRRGLAVGIYTGSWWWSPRTGDSAEFSALPLWYASYDGRAMLGSPGFGGWTEAAGKQWTDEPVDRSVFRGRWAARA